MFSKSLNLFLFCFFLFFITAAGQKRHFTGDETTEEEYKKIPLAASPSTRDISDIPSSYSLKAYAPEVLDQSASTCVAWSSAYAARTISYAIQHRFTNKDSISKYRFSPGFLFYFIRKPGDADCESGSKITNALNYLKSTGAVLYKKDMQDCTNTPPTPFEINSAEQFKIKDAVRIIEQFDQVSQNNIGEIKKAIHDNSPVIIGLKLTNSFENAMPVDGKWMPPPGEIPIPGHRHAMCIIGYDDNVNGGAFEVMNSWGAYWGNKGFFWITYKDLLTYCYSASSLVDFEASQSLRLSGSLDFILNDGSTMPVSRSGISTRSMSVHSDNDADYSQYRMNKVYPNGTSFKLKFSTNAPAYVYIFSEDNQHIISPVFPYRPDISAAINSANTSVYLPSENTSVQLDPTPATEHICVIYSKESIDFEMLKNYIKSTGTSTPEAVKAKFGGRVINVNEVNFDNNSIKFSAPVKQNSIVCFFIEMKHE